MKLFATFAAFTVASNNLSKNIKRTLSGDFVDSNALSSNARAMGGADDTFRTLAVMMAYAGGWGSDSQDPSANSDFAAELQRLEDKYTNYGCYCWIDGVDNGVIGGGKVRDFTDFQCKELYRCYKCVNIDYSSNYTEVNYSADLTVDDDGNRIIDCSVNAKSDAENICECDKRFAEKIALGEEECSMGVAGHPKGDYCMDENLRTVTGTRLDNGAAGSFDSRNMCEKAFPDHNKDKCCGIYPNRNPYDSSAQDCCETTDPTTGNKSYKKMQVGKCEDFGGRVVVSEAGNPHSYFALLDMITN